MESIEEQYRAHFKDYEDLGAVHLGPMTSATWRNDPKRLMIVLSRYKFVSKMLAGFNSVLEIGCGDAWASKIVMEQVKHLTLSDMDVVWQDHVKESYGDTLDFELIDFTKDSSLQNYDAIYALDVLEHIKREEMQNFLLNIRKSLCSSGVTIIGTPSLESQKYASRGSQLGHVNCMSGDFFKEVLEANFQRVFLFSMNDEVIHTGFYKMAHYLIGICVNPK